MLDGNTQHKFARGCAEAAAGYATAATAAYTMMASQALDFWCTALSGLDETTPVADDETSAKAAASDREPAFGMAMSDWCAVSWFDPRRFEAMLQLDTYTTPAVAAMAFANAVPLRGTSTSWPFAQVMIESGVPRAVAWPAAEANAAALGAADIASKRMRNVMATYHSESGFASTIRGSTPSLAGIMMAFGLSVSPLAFN